MATRDSGDSILPKEPRNEVRDIILKLRRHKGCEGECLRKEKFRAQVSRKLRSIKVFKETVRFVSFLNLTLWYTCIHGVYLANTV